MGEIGIDLDAMRAQMDPNQLAQEKDAQRQEVQRTVDAGTVLVGQDEEQEGAGQGGGSVQQSANQVLAERTQKGIRIQADQLKTPAVRDMLLGDQDDEEETAEAPAQHAQPQQRTGLLSHLKDDQNKPAGV